MATPLPDEPEWESSSNEEDFFVESKMGINEVRMLYDSLSFYSSIWPGPPDRPDAERLYLENVRSKLYAAIMEYNLIYNEVEEKE